MSIAFLNKTLFRKASESLPGLVSQASAEMRPILLTSPGRKCRTMATSTTTRVIPFIFAIVGVRAMWGQSAIDRLQPLVETLARRLVLAKQVALAKWDSRAPVEDPTREAQVITAAAKEG